LGKDRCDQPGDIQEVCVRVGVLNTAVPFVRGGAELLAEKLVLELERAGHEAELLRLPFAWSPPDRVVDSMVSAATLRIPNCDRLIALKFPTYLVPHDELVVWLLHQFRQAYDLWDHEAGWPDGPREREVRDLVRGADRAALSGARAVFCNSVVTQARLAEHLGMHAEVLLPPLLQDDGFTSGPYGDYLLALGRISRAKRQHLAIEAMAQLPPGAGRLVIAGPPDGEEDAHQLRQLVADHGLADRVEVLDEFISEQRKRELLAGARAVVYLPVDEDSYGYVTLEAAHAQRPLVTAADSGGILTLVEDGVTGLVVAPEAAALATAFAALLGDEQHAAAMGAAMHRRALDLRLSWQGVVGRLLA
jgi:glycosyltransferase involved in cell wall biosynthesis